MEDFWDQQFDLQGRDRTFWWLTAERLRRTGDLAYEVAKEAITRFQADPAAFTEAERAAKRMNVDLDLYKTSFFLYGLALENLLKGTLIARDPTRLERRKEFNHRLRRYFEEVGVQLTRKEGLLVKQLETLVIWGGRYPIPKSRSDWALREGPSGLNEMPGSISPCARDEIVELLELAEQHLADAGASPPASG